jgi:hypothetical protein
MTAKETFDQRTETGGREESSWTDAGHSVREQIHYICESTRSNGHKRELSFLRHLMLYDATEERLELEQKINRAERNERCARRAVGLMAVLTGLAVAGLGYSAILLEDFPQNTNQLLIRIFCALGLASLISLLAFVAFWLVARGELDEQREGCRRLVTRTVESRLGKPATVSLLEIVRTRSPRSRVAVEDRQAANGESS